MDEFNQPPKMDKSGETLVESANFGADLRNETIKKFTEQNAKIMEELEEKLMEAELKYKRTLDQIIREAKEGETQAVIKEAIRIAQDIYKDTVEKIKGRIELLSIK